MTQKKNIKILIAVVIHNVYVLCYACNCFIRILYCHLKRLVDENGPTTRATIPSPDSDDTTFECGCVWQDNIVTENVTHFHSSNMLHQEYSSCFTICKFLGLYYGMWWGVGGCVCGLGNENERILNIFVCVRIYLVSFLQTRVFRPFNTR